nr:MAG TPA: hypothetical protein [Caudoviricetes sp.]
MGHFQKDLQYGLDKCQNTGYNIAIRNKQGGKHYGR